MLIFPVVCVSVCLSFCLFDTHETIGSSHGTTSRPSSTGHVHYVARSLGKRAVGIGLKCLLVNLAGVFKTSLALISLIVLYLSTAGIPQFLHFPAMRFFVYRFLVQLSSKLHNLPKDLCRLVIILAGKDKRKQEYIPQDAYRPLITVPGVSVHGGDVCPGGSQMPVKTLPFCNFVAGGNDKGIQ